MASFRSGCRILPKNPWRNYCFDFTMQNTPESFEESGMNARLHTPGIKQARTQDFDEQATLLEGWHQHYVQLSSGRFEGTIVELLFDEIELFAESTSQALLQHGRLEHGVCAVGVPLRVTGPGTFCGETLQRNTVHIFSGNDGFEFHSPSRLVMGGIVAPENLLPDWLRERQVLEQAHLQSVPPEVLREAGEFLSLVFNMCRQRPSLLQSANFRRQLRSGVVACLVDVLDETAGPQCERASTPAKRWSLVRQARERLEEEHEATLDIEQLCRELGVSRRTLQYSFQEQAGMNPVAYLRAQRLNGVRRMLKQGASVTDAATTWGFWHFGHFSQEYKKLFGELPSDTLRYQSAPLSSSNALLPAPISATSL
jgi:AraC family ethanolamine operon transcriptional activator